jgi:hypothetical protein
VTPSRKAIRIPISSSCRRFLHFLQCMRGRGNPWFGIYLVCVYFNVLYDLQLSTAIQHVENVGPGKEQCLRSRWTRRPPCSSSKSHGTTGICCVSSGVAEMTWCNDRLEATSASLRTNKQSRNTPCLGRVAGAGTTPRSDGNI